MRALGRSISCALLLLFLVPSIARSFDRDHRERGKEAAYRAGFDDGYRNGLHHGEYDASARLRFNDHRRGYDRVDGYYRGEFINKGQFKKGYKDGYRQGYRDGYRRIGFPRYHRERYW